MEGNERRAKIIEILKGSDKPVSGTALAKTFGVSRQVIVQDVALLRAVEKNILATARGYMIFQDHRDRFYRCFEVSHPQEAIRDELMLMVDNGGKVLDVAIDHDVYGQIRADLILSCAADVEAFCDRLFKSHAKPLNILADGDHMHTVEAASVTILDNIERALRDRGYLIGTEEQNGHGRKHFSE